MSFDLYVWHEPAPITAADAASKVAAFAGGQQGVFAAHLAVPLLRAELLARFPPGDGTAQGDGPDAYVWSVTPAAGDSVLVLSCGWPHARLVGDAVRDGAKRHGLICYDPQEMLVEPNAPGAVAAFMLSSARLAPVADPDDGLLERTVRQVGADNFFVVLERADGWFVQVGFGARAGAADGVYALEFQEGSAERHFRCETRDMAEAVRLVREFHAGQDGWRRRHDWRPLQL